MNAGERLPGSSGDEIGQLVAQSEGRNLDFEADVPEVDEAAQLIAGLANSGGGQIVVGAEGQGKVTGLDDLKSVAAVFDEAADLIAPSLDLRFEPATFEGASLGVVTVPQVAGIVAGLGPLVDRDDKGESHVLTGEEISRALPSGNFGDEERDNLAEAMGKTNHELVTFRTEAKHAQSWRGQWRGWAVTTGLGLIAGVATTTMLG